VYPSIRTGLPPDGSDQSAILPKRRSTIGRNVVFLGLTSLFTDISSEMVTSILPIYLVFTLRFSPLEFGLIDGLYQGVAALLRIAGGVVADVRRRYKEVAGFGYALSAVCKLGLLVAGSSWGAVTGVLLLDRMGKGIRTAPRDALISLSAGSASLATAFGVHRALDTTGALIGPIIAFVLLLRAPDAFDVIFVASFCAALIGLGVLVLFVENRAASEVTIGRGAAWWERVRSVFADAPFRRLTIAASALSLVTISDGFLYLAWQRQLDFQVGFFPLLFVATALVYLVLAVPAGRLADRIGRRRVFIAGYGLLPIVYLTILLPEGGYAALAGALLLLGAYYAATDGVLMAIASSVLPADTRTTGLAVITTAIAICRLAASVALGALWTWWGMQAAAQLFVVGLVGALALTALLFRSMDGTDHREPAFAP
jgi:Major Facilitator Superfamily